jgi:NAD-dependent deacetylase
VTSREEAIHHLEPLVVLTGAGVSAESGIPTFRGEEGLWREFRAEQLATPMAFRKDPNLVWQFYDWRRQVVVSCSPNPAHQTLAQIEQHLDDFTLITQNVDGLHTQAGNKHVIELHGSLWHFKCISCEYKWRDLEVPLRQLPPHCLKCKSLARPDVVWFGESLDSSIITAAYHAAANAHTMVVIGTSALVQPANLIPLIAQDAGAQIIEFNLEPTPLTPYVDDSIQGPVGQTLLMWWNQFLGSSEK